VAPAPQFAPGRSSTSLIQPQGWPPSRGIRNSSDPGRQEFCRGKSTIYSQADLIKSFYQVTSGVVCTTKLTNDGRRAVRDFHLPGEFFGVETGQSYTCSAEAVCDVYLVRFDRKRLDASTNADGATWHQVLSWMLIDSERIAKRLLLFGRGSAVERLAFFLIDIAERYSAGTRLELPMTRTDIGDYLGLSSETVSRAFTTLREKDLVSIEGHTVTLRNVAALRILAGD
jgi:CRP/FNR family transcriptional regulator, nitrogen fixation regulation protein